MEAAMTFLRWGDLSSLGVGLLVLACGGGGSGGGVGPCTPGAATQLVKTSGDPAAWYLNNPLPGPLSVTARDANTCAVPGVVVSWAVASGGGAVNPAQSTTGTAGNATTTDSIGSSSPQTVTATFAGLATPVTFTASASAPPTSADVSVNNNSFNPQEAVVKTGGTVTWTWNSGLVGHNVTYSSGPGSLPPNSPTQAGGTTFSSTFTNVGTYAYHCTIHLGMEGTVKVLH
jgi:plastocyanin